MAEVSSTQVHQPHPNRVAGTSLLHPHSRGFSGGLLTSGFLASEAGALNGYFDEPGSTTRCTIILSGACSMKAAGQVHHFQARDLIMARTSAESFTFENSAEFSALEIHVPSPLLEQMQIEHFPRIQRRSLELQDPALKTAKQLFGYLRTIPAAQSPETLVGYGLAMTMLGYAFTTQKTARSQLTAKTIHELENARKALLARLDQAPTIPQLAALCDLSPTRFKELFSRQYGCGPYTLYQSHRMEYARSLLERLNVTETAMELGYSNVSHFSAAFQRKFGYLPSRVKRPHSCK